MLTSVLKRLNERRDRAGDPGLDSGFTLIELMVVLLILAILLAIAIPTFLGVTGGANDRAAQSNLNTALTTAKAAAAEANQSYSSVDTTLLSSNEPSLTWSTDGSALSTQGPISVAFRSGGAGVVLASFSSNNSTCWFAADNQIAANAADGYGPTPAGVYYAKSTGGTCDAASAPAAGATNWFGSFAAAAA